MENEENKNNEIVEETVPTEEAQTEEPELEEYVEQRYDEEPEEAEKPETSEELTQPEETSAPEEPASVEEPVAEESTSAEEETAPDETPVEEKAEVVPEETSAEAEPAQEETPIVEESVPEGTPVEEEPVSEEMVTEEPQEESTAEESAEEEPATEEAIAEETAAEEVADDDTDLIIEEVILIDEEPKKKEPEIIVEEITEEELEDAIDENVSTEEAAVEEAFKEEVIAEGAIAEEVIIEEIAVEPETVEPQLEPEPEWKPEVPTEPFADELRIAEFSEPEPSEPEPFEPEPEAQPISKPRRKEKGKGGLAVKVIGLVVILLLIFIPAGFSLFKGELFRKELIDYKNGISNTYESYFRKEIFPKLSAAFVPQWAKQMKLEEEQRAAEEAKRKAEEAKKAEEDRKKDILYGVPQVPDGLEYFPLYYDDRMIVYGRDNWLYTAGDTSLDCYAGTNVLSEEEMAVYANLLDTLGNLCKAKGVELVMEVAPNKEQVYPEHYPSVTVENPKKRLLVMEQYMRENCSVPFLYPIRELAANKGQYETYWQYDTHWNTTGAFIGMKEIYKALGMPINNKDVSMRTEATNRGDLAGIAGYTDLYTDYITEYKPNVTVSREVFNDSDYDIDEYGVRYISTADNERKLVICGDSFRVSLGAHMSKDYKCTDVIHRDILNSDGAIASLRALTEGDTLVLICVERWDYRMFDAIYSLIAIMQES